MEDDVVMRDCFVTGRGERAGEAFSGIGAESEESIIFYAINLKNGYHRIT